MTHMWCNMRNVEQYTPPCCMLQTVPASQLLEFNVNQGWEPLCTFLETTVPEEPFPNKNSTEEINKYRHMFFTTKAWQIVAMFVVVGLGAGFVARRLR